MERSKITIKEFSEYMGISIDLAYKLCREREVPHVRIGRRILLDKNSVDRWFQGKEKMHPGEGAL
ncbi:helix-turn-helix domain-containing protein [Halobacillus karajensis]|uniref:DNA binding domain, excisionase family n=1 Tax=Halobacillus karajensis TaxID=195088 RepID=A0A024P892_9BACI|nr:helix-turn-helix domain-containing protein [Halobacillus karajensis]CDQ20990.1 DNA binding domain, excisionase family [Halobacillus karajensis]CDQ24946.1 DNA binding domain, excisionase family [Halobacillus karajensis]CDQ28693.1 DNA binding domain, excisionase family [Halobacillus karajensis]